EAAPRVLRKRDAAAGKGRSVAEQVGDLQAQEDGEQEGHRAEHDDAFEVSPSWVRRRWWWRRDDGSRAQGQAVSAESRDEQRDEERKPRDEVESLEDLDDLVPKRGENGIGAGKNDGEHTDHDKRKEACSHDRMMSAGAGQRAELAGAPGRLGEAE